MGGIPGHILSREEQAKVDAKTPGDRADIFDALDARVYRFIAAEGLETGKLLRICDRVNTGSQQSQHCESHEEQEQRHGELEREAAIMAN